MTGTNEDGFVKLLGTGIRTVLQAIGFLALKKARDPLEGIQQLEYMNLVSGIQQMTK